MIIAGKAQANYEKMRDEASEELKYYQDKQASLNDELKTTKLVNVIKKQIAENESHMKQA